MKKRGYTLIEIIVTLVIIALIGTISIVVFNKDDTEKKMKKYKENIESSAIVYFELNDELKKELSYFNETNIRIGTLIDKGLLKEENYSSIKDHCVKIYYDDNNMLEIEYSKDICKERPIETNKPTLILLPMEFEYNGVKKTIDEVGASPYTLLKINDEFVDDDGTKYHFYDVLKENKFWWDEKPSIEMKEYFTLSKLVEKSTPKVTKFGFYNKDTLDLIITSEELDIPFNFGYAGGGYKEKLNGLESNITLFMAQNNTEEDVNNRKKLSDFFKNYTIDETSNFTFGEENGLGTDMTIDLMDNSGPILIKKDTLEKYDKERDYITYYPNGGFGYNYNVYDNYPDYLKKIEDSWLDYRDTLDSNLFRDYYLFDNKDGITEIHKYIREDENGVYLYPTVDTDYNEIYTKYNSDDNETELYKQFVQKIEDSGNTGRVTIDIALKDSKGKTNNTEILVLMHEIGAYLNEKSNYGESTISIDIRGLNERKIKSRLLEYFDVFNHDIENCGSAGVVNIALCTSENENSCIWDYEDEEYKTGSYNYIRTTAIDDCNAENQLFSAEIELYNSYTEVYKKEGFPNSIYMTDKDEIAGYLFNFIGIDSNAPTSCGKPEIWYTYLCKDPNNCTSPDGTYYDTGEYYVAVAYGYDNCSNSCECGTKVFTDEKIELIPTYMGAYKKNAFPNIIYGVRGIEEIASYLSGYVGIYSSVPPSCGEPYIWTIYLCEDPKNCKYPEKNYDWGTEYYVAAKYGGSYCGDGCECGTTVFNDEKILLSSGSSGGGYDDPPIDIGDHVEIPAPYCVALGECP